MGMLYRIINYVWWMGMLYRIINYVCYMIVDECYIE